MERNKSIKIVGIAVAVCVVVLLAILLFGTKGQAGKGVYGEDLDVIQEEGVQTVYDTPANGGMQEEGGNGSATGSGSAESSLDGSASPDSAASNYEPTSTTDVFGQNSSGGTSSQNGSEAPSAELPIAELPPSTEQDDTASGQQQSGDTGMQPYHEEFELPEVEV